MILNGLKQHGYSSIDEYSNVCHLTNGIKTKALNSVKTQILSSVALCDNFSACVNLFQDFIDQDANQETKTITIAAIRNPDDGDMQPDMSVEDIYYNCKEYAKLTAAQKLGLKAKRDKRGHKSKQKRGSSSDGKIDLSKKTIVAKATIIALKSDGDWQMVEQWQCCYGNSFFRWPKESNELWECGVGGNWASPIGYYSGKAGYYSITFSKH